MVAISASVQSSERQPRHRRAAQIIERHADNAGLVRCLAPRCAESVRVHGLPSELSRMIGHACSWPLHQARP